MHETRFTFSLVLLLLLASFSVGQQTGVSVGETQTVWAFTEVKGLPDEIEPSYFEFSASSYNYRILRNGRGGRTGGGSPARSFNLRLERDNYLDRAIYHAEYQGDVLLVCEVTDGVYGGGIVVRLDGRTLRTKWKRWLPAFNVGQGLVEGNYAYVTAIGFIGKINLNSGNYVWQHDNLYGQDDSAFNSFELPEIRGDIVLFRESENYLRRRVATIQIERRSGRITNINR